MFYEIGRLVNLVTLRLEYGSYPNDGLGDALTRLIKYVSIFVSLNFKKFKNLGSDVLIT